MPHENKWSDIAVVEFPEGTNFGVDPITLAKDYVEEDGDDAVIVGYGRYRVLNGLMGKNMKSLFCGSRKVRTWFVTTNHSILLLEDHIW